LSDEFLKDWIVVMPVGEGVNFCFTPIRRGCGCNLNKTQFPEDRAENE
jgi:hypothetical protein